MGSQIPDPEIRMREVMLLSGGQQTEYIIRAAAKRGEIECRRDAANNRLFRFSSVVRWLENVGALKSVSQVKEGAKLSGEAYRKRTQIEIARARSKKHMERRHGKV